MKHVSRYVKLLAKISQGGPIGLEIQRIYQELAVEIQTSRANQTRKASHAVRDGVFRPKAMKDIWTGDAGAYPIMFGIGWCLFFATGFSAYYALSSPDVRMFGKSRDKVFRGELNEYTRATA